jgi:hypothetical protein
VTSHPWAHSKVLKKMNCFFDSTVFKKWARLTVNLMLLAQAYKERTTWIIFTTLKFLCQMCLKRKSVSLHSAVEVCTG